MAGGSVPPPACALSFTTSARSEWAWASGASHIWDTVNRAGLKFSYPDTTAPVGTECSCSWAEYAHAGRMRAWCCRTPARVRTAPVAVSSVAARHVCLGHGLVGGSSFELQVVSRSNDQKARLRFRNAIRSVRRHQQLRRKLLQRETPPLGRRTPITHQLRAGQFRSARGTITNNLSGNSGKLQTN